MRRNFLTREEPPRKKPRSNPRASGRRGYRPVLTALTEAQAREAESIFARVAGKPHPLTFYVDFAGELPAAGNAKVSWELKRLEKRFKDIVIAEITSTLLTEYLEADKPTVKTYNNRRGVLSHFFKYRWAAPSPIFRCRVRLTFVVGKGSFG